MSAFGRMHKATALVPLAVLSAAWTASMAGAGLGSAVAGDEASGALPDGTTVPTRPSRPRPACPVPGVVAPGVPPRPGGPDRRRRLHQRHPVRRPGGLPARRGGHQLRRRVLQPRLAADRRHRPGRVRPRPLRRQRPRRRRRRAARASTASRSTARTTPSASPTPTPASTTRTRTYDRAVGPMQFIPSTWSVVGVDGDNDGRRNPQDIDDAALATAVYLCSGDDDLSAEQGQRASVYRYNHSNDYVDLVLSIMQAYMDGDFTVRADPHHLRRRLRPGPDPPVGAGPGQGPGWQGRPAGQHPGRGPRHDVADGAAHQDADEDPDADADNDEDPDPAADPAADPGPHQAPDQAAGPRARRCRPCPRPAPPRWTRRSPTSRPWPSAPPRAWSTTRSPPPTSSPTARTPCWPPEPWAQPSSRARTCRACASVVPAELRRQPPLPGSSMASQKAAHSGRQATNRARSSRSSPTASTRPSTS